MNSLLEKLFRGKIFPAVEILPTDPRHRETESRIEEVKDHLEKVLPAEEIPHLEELWELYLAYSSMECSASFSYGFRLATQLMHEAFNDGTIPLFKSE